MVAFLYPHVSHYPDTTASPTARHRVCVRVVQDKPPPTCRVFVGPFLLRPLQRPRSSPCTIGFISFSIVLLRVPVLYTVLNEERKDSPYGRAEKAIRYDDPG
jgi:hypothetical protein